MPAKKQNKTLTTKDTKLAKALTKCTVPQLLELRLTYENSLRLIILEGERRAQDTTKLKAPMKTEEELLGRTYTPSAESAALNPYRGTEASKEVEGMGISFKNTKTGQSDVDTALELNKPFTPIDSGI